MDYPHSWKAFNQFAESYEDYGGPPDEVTDIVRSATKAIKELIDRPDAEKDELIATVALIFSSDVAIYKSLPPNLDEYSPAIKKNLEDALASIAAEKQYGGTPDMRQVGLAMMIALTPALKTQLEELRDDIKDLDDPRAIKLMKKAIDEIIEKQKQQETAEYFTGAQPRLEAEAQKQIGELQAVIDDLSQTLGSLKPAEAPVRPVRTYSPPPPPPA